MPETISQFLADQKRLAQNPQGDAVILSLGKPKKIAPPAGQPSEINGHPCYYYEKELGCVGDWRQRNSGKPFTIDQNRIETWLSNNRKWKDAGHSVFVPGEHRDKYNAEDNHGWVIDFNRNDKSIKAVMQIIGDRSDEIAAKNDVSLYVVDGKLDAKGQTYGELIEHVALTPNPNQPGLAPFVRIAASADAAEREVPVLCLSASSAPFKEKKTMTPEQIAKALKALGLTDANATPESLIDGLISKLGESAGQVIALSADKQIITSAKTAAETERTALTTERDALKIERDQLIVDRDAAKREVVALSADRPIKLDAANLAAVASIRDQQRSIAIQNGFAPAALKPFDDLIAGIVSTGEPTLKLSADAQPRFATHLLYEALANLVKSNAGGIVTGTGVERPAGTVAAVALALTGDGKEMDIKQVADAVVNAQIKKGYGHNMQAATVLAK